VSTIEELLWRKKRCSGLENREYVRRDPWLVDLLLGNEHERDNGTTTAGKQRSSDIGRMAFLTRSAKQQLNSNRGTLVSVLSVSKYYKCMV
jgi:hypothetical protein